MLHIRPWEVGDLTVDEFEALCSWVDRALKRDDEEG